MCQVFNCLSRYTDVYLRLPPDPIKYMMTGDHNISRRVVYFSLVAISINYLFFSH